VATATLNRHQHVSTPFLIPPSRHRAADCPAIGIMLPACGQ